MWCRIWKLPFPMLLSCLTSFLGNLVRTTTLCWCGVASMRIAHGHHLPLPYNCCGEETVNVYTRQGALFSCSHETKPDILQVPLYVSSVSPHLLIQSCFRQNKEVTHAPTNRFGYRCGCCKLTWWWECKCKGQLRQDQELDEESREIVLAFKLSWHKITDRFWSYY